MTREETPGPSKVIVLADAACGDAQACKTVRNRAGVGAEVLVVAPVAATDEAWITDEDEARMAARKRLKFTIGCLQQLGLSAKGRLGDEDPIQAADDALHGFPADEIILLALPHEHSGWLGRETVNRAIDRFGDRVSYVPIADPRRTAARA